MNLPRWRNAKTCVIRIPEAFREEVLSYAHSLDEGVFVPEGELIRLTHKDVEKLRAIIVGEEFQRNPKQAQIALKVLERFISLMIENQSDQRR